jgi:hypothetical protein
LRIACTLRDGKLSDHPGDVVVHVTFFFCPVYSSRIRVLQ